MSKQLANNINKSERQVLSEGLVSGQRVVYEKKSMKRFGDDLTEEVLQYLTFSDKVRLESVSKQWKRLIFNKQFVFEVEEYRNRSIENQNTLNRMTRMKVIGSGWRQEIKYSVDRQALESVLKKSPNLTTIILRNCYIKELSLFGQYCQHIRRLEFCNNYSMAEELILAESCGHQLRELVIYGSIDRIYYLKDFINLCPNLKTFDFIDNNEVFISKHKDLHFFPKLERIGRLKIQKKTSNKIGILYDMYHKTIKDLTIKLCEDLTTDDLKTCLTQLSLFDNLQSLDLTIDCHTIQQNSIDECLEQLTRKCDKLIDISI